MNKGSICVKETPPGLTLIECKRPSCTELFVTSERAPGESADVVFRRAAAAVAERGGRIVAQDVFGFEHLNNADEAALRNVSGELGWPVTWVRPTGDSELSGTQLWAVVGPTVKPLDVNGRIVGSLFEDEHCRYCRLGGVSSSSSDPSRSREAQALDTLNQLEAVLKQADMDFSNVVRTWFYNDDILDWYGGFNKTRDDFFTQRRVFGELVPASTGIGGPNPAGTALVTGLLAIDFKSGDAKAEMVPSPLQCSALDYGSSFSRAVEVDTPDCRRLLVSGTASIEAGGDTEHVDDIAGQVDLTMRVVAAILESCGMSWLDVVRGVAYVRNASDAPAYESYCSDHGLGTLPVVVANNVVCRDNLLFEIEVDAIR